VAGSLPTLKLNGINKSFSGVSVLNNVSLELFPGEVHCLLGENGAGKSTLIKIMSGAYIPDSGSINYQGEEIGSLTPRWAREHGISTIYQEIDLVPHLNAAENILLGEEPLKAGGSINWKEVRQRAKSIFDNMGVEIDMKVPVGTLKMAQQQMVAIAKALSMNSKLLILDEPTSVFTSKEVDLLFKIVKDLKAQEMAILFISHHLDEIFQIGDRITVLRDGNLVKSGAISEFDKMSLVKAMVGRDIDLTQRADNLSTSEVLLSVNNMSSEGVIKDISFKLHRGEVLGIGGLVGAGRTEMVSVLIGADPIDSGEISIKGKPVTINSPRKALKLGMGMVPESRKENGLVGVRSMAENAGYSYVEIKSRYGLVNWKDIKAKTYEIIKKLEVRPQNPELKVSFLSGGNQQKIVLGKWLAAGCDILILDEPTRGVDVGARTEIYSLIQELKKSGKAILMVSSDMTELLTQSDRILVMSGGSIVAEMDGKEATEEKILSYALQLGGEA
jgi:ABC-type sugar transport system ATPase subunit